MTSSTSPSPNRPTPWLFVVDRQGKTVVDGDVDGQPKERTIAVLQKFSDFLKKQQQTAKASASDK
jgi:hypothetical protein